MEKPKVGETWETEKGQKVILENGGGGIRTVSSKHTYEGWFGIWNLDGSCAGPHSKPNVEKIFGRLVHRIHPSPESTQQDNPSPFWVRPEEREAVKIALEAFVFETDKTTEKYGPILNPIIDRFTDPRNQEAA